MAKKTYNSGRSSNEDDHKKIAKFYSISGNDALDIFTVSGEIHSEDVKIKPATLAVKAFHVGLRGEELLGGTFPNETGYYEITYRSFQTSRLLFANPNLRLRVFTMDTQEVVSSEIIYKSSPKERVDLVVRVDAVKELSEYEHLMKVILPVLEDLPIQDLTDNHIEFLEKKTGVARFKIITLRDSAKLSVQTDIPPEIFFGLILLDLPSDLDKLLEYETSHYSKALNEAIERKIIPSSVSASLADIVKRFEQLKEENELRKQRETTFQFSAQLLHHNTKLPLEGYLVSWVYFPKGDDSTKDTGRGKTLVRGIFTCSLTKYVDSTFKPMLVLTILDANEKEIKKNIEVAEPAKQEALAQILVHIPGAEAVEIGALAEQLKLAVPGQLLSFLKEHKILTLADIRKAGGIGTLEKLPVEPEHPAIKTLDAHADLARVSADIALNIKLIHKGYTSVLSISGPTRAKFVEDISESVHPFQAATIYEKAKAQTVFIDNAIIGIQSNPGNGVTSIEEWRQNNPIAGLLPTPCECKDCQAAVSPLAYLADLLTYTLKYLKKIETVAGIRGEYYDSINLTNLKRIRIDSKVDADWIFGTPDPSLEIDNFSIRWTGEVQPRYSELYTFLTESDDGIRLWVDGKILIDDWHDHGITINQGKLQMEAGKKYSIRLEYYEKVYTATIKLRWQSARQAEETIPTSQLSTFKAKPIDLKFLSDTFLQPFGQLPASCSAVEKKVRQVRLCIEVLRKYLENNWNTRTQYQRDTLANEERNYRLEAYKALLLQIGSSYEEIRTARASNEEDRVSIANKLAIDLNTSTTRPDHLDELFLDPLAATGQPFEITEPVLESLFGLTDTDPTRRDPLSDIFPPKLQQWRFKQLRTQWKIQDWPEDPYIPGAYKDGLLPIIDPDVIGPDEFRFPVAKPQNTTAPDLPFDFWLRRRQWIDNRLNALRTTAKTTIRTKQIPDLTLLITNTYGTITYGTTILTPWTTAPQLSEFETIFNDLNQSNSSQIHTLATTKLSGFGITVKGFTRLMEIYYKNKLFSTGYSDELVSDDEWEEIYSILVQAQKQKLFAIWRQDEQTAGIILEARVFYLPLQEPTEGIWPPLVSVNAPTIDPEITQVKDLPEGLVGWRALALLKIRQGMMDQIRIALKNKLEQSGFDEMLKLALGNPYPGDNLPHDLQQLKLDLSSTTTAIVEAAKNKIRQDLFLSVEQFSRLLLIKAEEEGSDTTKKPTEAELNEVYSLLGSAQKLKREYSGWYNEEQQGAIKLEYWRTSKAKLPKWRASAEDRNLWQQALISRTEKPVIDPDLINPADFINPQLTDDAFALWDDRNEWIKEILLDIKSTTSSIEINRFDQLLVSNVAGDFRLLSLQTELKAIREAEGLAYLLKHLFPDPLPDLNQFLADVNSTDPVTSSLARFIITENLYWNVSAFKQFISIRSKTPESSITGTEWDELYTILAQRILVEDIISVGDGIRKIPFRRERLVQVNLSASALGFLVRIRRLAAKEQNILPNEWEEVYSILGEVVKARYFAEWKEAERKKEIQLSPDFFKISKTTQFEFPPKELVALPVWRATQRSRNDWIEILQSRIDQEQAVVSGIQAAVSSVEEATLPLLRQALIRAFEEDERLNILMPKSKADRITDTFLIDAKAGGCQVTTRISQAIETLQGILWSIRTGQLNDTYPDLALDLDHFDEAWKWIGSYATWRAAMFVYLYPENILQPSLRKWQTPAFKELVKDLRFSRRLTREQACKAAKKYSEYFLDVSEIKLETTCLTNTKIYKGDNCQKGQGIEYRNLFYMFARGSSTNDIYWSAYDESNESGFAQTFWEKVPGLQNCLDIIGSIPYSQSATQRFIILFVRQISGAEQKLIFTKYDLEARNWDGAPKELKLKLPRDAGSFTAVAKQTITDNQPPHLAVRVADGSIYERKLSRDASEWADNDWALIVGSRRGSRFERLFAMFEISSDEFILIVGVPHTSKPGEFLAFYRLCGNRDDGNWCPIWNGSFCGGVLWSEIASVCCMVSYQGSLDCGRLQISSSKGNYFDYIGQFDNWLLSVAGLSLKEINVQYWMSFNPNDRSTDLFNFLTLNLGYLPQDILDNYRNIVYGNIDIIQAYINEDSTRGREWKQADEMVKKLIGVPLVAVVRNIYDLSLPLPGIFHLEDPSRNGNEFRFINSFPSSFENIFFLPNWESPGNENKKVRLAGAQKLLDKRESVYVILTKGASGNIIPAGEKPVTLFSNELIVITEQLSESQLQVRHEQIKSLFLANAGRPASHLTYLEEACYFVPIYLALQLHQSGQYIAALDWLRTVYDYGQPHFFRKQKIYYGLELEESKFLNYQRVDNWLLDPLNPHAIAATRSNTYTRFTLLSIIRCLLDYADAEFSLDTSESVPRARTLYSTALELLNYPELQQNQNDCDALIANLKIEVEDPKWVQKVDEIKYNVTTLQNGKQIEPVIQNIMSIMATSNPYSERIENVERLINEAIIKNAEETPLMNEVLEKHTVSRLRAHSIMVKDDLVSEAIERTAIKAERKFINTFSATNDNEEIFTRLSDSRRGVLTLYSSDLTSNRTLVKNGGVKALDIVEEADLKYVPGFSFQFCTTPNPILKGLRLRAELNLYKIRTCRNIAGMSRMLDPYAAATDTESGLPLIGAGGQLILPGTILLRPTPYRYVILIERAKQLVSLAQQIESAMLSALEKLDNELYNLMKARQDVRLALAGVQLQQLRVKEAEGGIKLAELQQERAQIQVNHYQNLLDEGTSELEEEVLRYMGESSRNQVMASNLSFIASGLYAIAAAAQGSAAYKYWADTGGAGASFAIGAINSSASIASSTSSGYSSLAGAASTNASIVSTRASYERRSREWEFSKNIAGQDVLIGAQQVRSAEDHVRVVGQEHSIAQMQADNAKETVEFLSNKFTNAELYDWMSGILENVYRFFLQQATSMAQLASNQLAFERQETSHMYIQADYWEIPSDNATSVKGNVIDRRGLTGSARLLQDIYQLDQYAFETNKRKLQLTQNFSLSRLAPIEFQRFRETGVMIFKTPMELFDRQFPGHYLRLIRKVRTSVIALIPPTEGIHATLTATGVSRVVIGGDIFQTVIVRREPESIALSSPFNTAGLFELETQSDMPYPFEWMGVDSIWELRMPKGSNLFDYRTIADVLITIEYTALNSFDYRHQVIQQLNTKIDGERSFSFRNNFPDQWFDLNNPDQTKTPMKVTFRTFREDFPPNMENSKIKHLALYISRVGDQMFEVKNINLSYKPKGGNFVGGSADSINGLISTRQGNAASWNSIISSNTLAGEWELSFLDTNVIREHFKNGEIEDILFVITYEGDAPSWPS